MINEISWEELSNRIGKKVEETTTVTKRVRRRLTAGNKSMQKIIFATGNKAKPAQMRFIMEHFNTIDN